MEKEEMKSLIRILISLFLFIIAFFVLDERIKMFFYFLSYMIISYEMYVKTFQNIKNKEMFDENLLMIIATLGAFYIKSYQEGILVILLFQTGELLSDLAVSKSKKSITDLMDLRVEKMELEDGTIIPVEKAKIGDNFIVKPGDIIPLDGMVLKGKSYLDMSSITGESKPKKVEENDSVISGCINRESVLTIKASTTYKTSTAQKIIDLIEQEEDEKSETEKWITKFAKIYTPIIVLISVLLFIIPVCLGYNPNTWLYRSIIFIVTSCPCALVISVPLGYFCGIGKASKDGILIKGAKELEDLSKIDTIILDKTGTITEGIIRVSEINTTMNKKEFLQIIASAEKNSKHPISEAIKTKNHKDLLETTHYKELSGRGISCRVEKKEVLIGNERMMREHNISFDENNQPNTVIYCAIDGEYIGNIVVEDKIKESSYELLNQNNNYVILSGDNHSIVEDVAKKLHIKEYFGDLLPEDKVRITEEYKKKGKVLFVGDGMNDAPVLKKADIGISLGNIGTDAALEASDIVLMDDDISKIEDAISISKYTHKKVMQSIIIALVVKITVLILGIFGMSTIIMAVFADVGVTLLAIINVLLIFKHKKKA